MTYDEAMHWWFGRVNYEVQAPQPSDLNLDRIRLLLTRLGNPERRLRIVHIAGSKGKGSTSAMLAAILQHAGWRVGLFTSPHLQNVEERVQIDGTPISREELAGFMREIRIAAAQPLPGATEPLDVRLTFFEIATALGLLHFARRRADFAVLEVGLGGRYDSTNVCEPLVAVIASISLDHTQQLGNTLAKIAFEKAGIIKQRIPVVSGVIDPEARDVIRAVSREREALLYERDRDIRFEHVPARIDNDTTREAQVRIHTWRGATPWLALGLVGAHQAANAALAVAAVELLRAQGVPVSDQAVADGLAQVRWPGRLEIVGHRPLVVLDCAHNVASAQALTEALVESFPMPTGARRVLIFAGSRDKDLAGMLAVLAPHFDHVYLTRFTSPRCLPPESLVAMLPPTLQAAATLCESPAAALAAARRDARSEDAIIAAGSVFLAGELRSQVFGGCPPTTNGNVKPR